MACEVIHSPTWFSRRIYARRPRSALDSRPRGEFGDETCEREDDSCGPRCGGGKGGRQDGNGGRPCERRSCLGGFLHRPTLNSSRSSPASCFAASSPSSTPLAASAAVGLLLLLCVRRESSFIPRGEHALYTGPCLLPLLLLFRTRNRRSYSSLLSLALFLSLSFAPRLSYTSATTAYNQNSLPCS